MEDNYLVRNQIVTLLYEQLEKDPDSFQKLDDNTVVTFFDLTTVALLSSPSLQEKFSGIELKITRKEEELAVGKTELVYELNALGAGNMYFKYFVSELDSKTAYKFFQTNSMLNKELKDFILIRDTLLKFLGR